MDEDVVRFRLFFLESLFYKIGSAIMEKCIFKPIFSFCLAFYMFIYSFSSVFVFSCKEIELAFTGKFKNSQLVKVTKLQFGSFSLNIQNEIDYPVSIANLLNNLEKIEVLRNIEVPTELALEILECGRNGEEMMQVKNELKDKEKILISLKQTRSDSQFKVDTEKLRNDDLKRVLEKYKIEKENEYIESIGELGGWYFEVKPVDKLINSSDGFRSSYISPSGNFLPFFNLLLSNIGLKHCSLFSHRNEYYLKIGGKACNFSKKSYSAESLSKICEYLKKDVLKTEDGQNNTISALNNFTEEVGMNSMSSK